MSQVRAAKKTQLCTRVCLAFCCAQQLALLKLSITCFEKNGDWFNLPLSSLLPTFSVSLSAVAQHFDEWRQSLRSSLLLFEWNAICNRRLMVVCRPQFASQDRDLKSVTCVCPFQIPSHLIKSCIHFECFSLRAVFQIVHSIQNVCRNLHFKIIFFLLH